MTAMSGSNFYTYVLNIFKRTDKEAVVYEAITDACQKMAQRFSFDELSEDKTTTDVISVLGDYKINLETDFEKLASDIVLIDENYSDPLIKKTKSEFDELYPNPGATNVSKSRPKHYCIYGGQIYIGPVPDSTSYSYRISYSTEAGTVTSATSSVPFTSKYRMALRYLVLHLLYSGLESDTAAQKYFSLFESEFETAMDLENRNKKGVTTVNYRGM